MKRYLPLFLMSFFLVVVCAIGSGYLAGYADKANPEHIKQITVYTTLPVEQVAVLAAAYESEQGVRVNIVPLSAQEAVSQAKDHPEIAQGDLLLTTESVLEQAKAAQELLPYSSVHTDLVPQRFRDNGNAWVGLWYDPIVFAENKDFLNENAKSIEYWNDLVNSKVRVGITDFMAAEASANLLYMMNAELGTEKTLSYFGRLHPHVVQYSAYLVTPVRMVCLREADVAVTVQSEAVRYAKDNLPVKIVYPVDGTAYFLTGAGILTGSTHKAEAGQFLDWLLQDNAQCMLYRNRYYFVPANPATLVYRDYAGKIKLYTAKVPYSAKDKGLLLDKWVQGVRLK